MSEYVPFDIQIEIIKKLPIKSLLQFRSVSKSWKSIIDSSEFVANYHLNNDQLQHRVLVSYDSSTYDHYSNVEDLKYVTIVDDDSFPQNKFPLILPSCSTQLLGYDPSILGSSQGVFCLCVNFGESTYWYYSFGEAKTFVLWNPTIQKSVPVIVPGGENDMKFRCVFGFGVCPRTSVHKLVKISYISTLRFDYLDIDKHSQIEIFSLSSGSCRRSFSMNVPRISIELDREHVCVDKCIYWYAFDRTVTPETKRKKNLILSFDMTTEEFTEIDLCDGLKEEYAGKAYGCCGYLSISKLGTSLVVLQPKGGYGKEISVWRMEHGVPNSFTKLFVIKSPIESLGIDEVHGFRKTGEPIIDTGMTTTDKNYIGNIVVYEPKLGEISDIGITSAGYLCLAQSYIETLVLLDHRGGE
ncbi:putative F-box protein At3g10430 [Rutidosis leptorrhynchoides]|uniref:putative F-box protein At3g10430 n=1 Tax=Rutidosis leptorrhynchoides TaxID=125765 RepID=UPI003A9976E2